jgi:hypothetical protein
MRMIVIDPGEAPVIEDVSDLRERIGGYITHLPNWAVPCHSLGLSAVAWSVSASGETAANNFLAVSGGDIIRGTVILFASSGDGETVDVSEVQQEKGIHLAETLIRSRKHF